MTKQSTIQEWREWRERQINADIKSIFVTRKSLEEAMECVSKDWTRTILVEPPDLDGYFKVKAVEDEYTC
jgi:hypothetical protein